MGVIGEMRAFGNSLSEVKNLMQADGQSLTALRQGAFILLKNYKHLAWSIQGLGMLRFYINDTTRLHIWDADYVTDGVSPMHTHPWDYESICLSGYFTNIIFMESMEHGHPFKKQSIFCGEGGGLEGDPEDVLIQQVSNVTYRVGGTYEQKSTEVHEAHPSDGCVTMIQRKFHDDVDHAAVYFQGEWGSAEPRPATNLEVEAICEKALEGWS